MGLIECPNCKKETFDDDKCQWCKYSLKEKENQFNKEIYSTLKDNYVVNLNKQEAIKLGMSKFNLSMNESKEIVDYIADEHYEKNNYKSYDEINRECVNETYKFSFSQYFIRNFIIKILVAIILANNIKTPESPMVSIGIMVLLFLWILLSLYNLVKKTTIGFRIDGNKIEYFYRSSTHIHPTGKKFESMSGRGQFNEYFARKHIYEITSITDIIENVNSIIIKGKIKHTVNRFLESGELIKNEKDMINSIKIPKYFKNNGELIKNLKSHLPHNYKK